MTSANTIQPNSDHGIEQIVLGAIVLERDAIWKVCDILQPKVFDYGPHKRIYAACLALANDSVNIDLISVKAKLNEWNELESVGGVIALTDLCSKVGSAANLQYHATVLHELWQRREWESVGAQIASMAKNRINPEKIAESVQMRIDDIEPNIDTNLHTIQNLIIEVDKELAEIEKYSREAKLSGEQYSRGISTGFPSLDRMTNGLKPKTFVIIAARPAMGKTAFVLQILKAAGAEHVAALFCLEMSAVMLGMRMIAQGSGRDMGLMQRGMMDQIDWIKIRAFMNVLKDSVIYIDDTSALSILSLRAKVKRLAMKGTLSLIAIDYIQLMSGNKRGGREQELSGISRALKQISMDFNIPVIALAQLNREVEKRNPPRPKLSDLRESGAMEQDADEVWFLYRPEYYDILVDENGDDMRGIAKIIIAKQRNGPIGDVDLQWNPDSVSFSEIGQLNRDHRANETKIVPMPNDIHPF